MIRYIWAIRIGAVAIVTLGLTASVEAQFRYSTDIGSDLDISDPTSLGNGISDAGDIYAEPGGPAAGPVKNDDPGGPNTGYPLAGTVMAPFGGLAGQPSPPPGLPGGAFTVGGGGIGAPAAAVRAEYNDGWDLDAEDQLQFVVPALPTTPVLLGAGRDVMKAAGVNFEPTELFYSFDDDGAPGWWVTPDVPTVVGPDRGTAAAMDEVLGAVGAFGAWAPAGGVRDEVALGLGPNPIGGAGGMGDPADDDVDALDLEEFQYWYWSADHEANYSSYGAGLAADPGSIYMTDLLAAGANQVQILDDVLNFGVPFDTDVDAFEFLSVSAATFELLFGYAADGVADGLGPDVLTGLFSVDENDPDNDGGLVATDIHGIETGGLLPGGVYISDLISGTSGVGPVLLVDYGEDIDALTVNTVPEPGTFSMSVLAVFGLLMFRGRRRQR